MNVAEILDLIKGTIGKINDTVNTATPIANDIVDKVGPLVEQGQLLADVGKSLFLGEEPDPAKLAAAEALRIEKDTTIVSS